MQLKSIDKFVFMALIGRQLLRIESSISAMINHPQENRLIPAQGGHEINILAGGFVSKIIPDILSLIIQIFQFFLFYKYSTYGLLGGMCMGFSLSQYLLIKKRIFIFFILEDIYHYNQCVP